MDTIIVKITITTPAGTVLHESTQTVRTDIGGGAPSAPLPMYPGITKTRPAALPPIPYTGSTSTKVMMDTPSSGEPVAKRKPGRPRKHPLPDPNVPVVKRKPGRPRKVDQPQLPLTDPAVSESPPPL